MGWFSSKLSSPNDSKQPIRHISTVRRRFIYKLPSNIRNVLNQVDLTTETSVFPSHKTDKGRLPYSMWALRPQLILVTGSQSRVFPGFGTLGCHPTLGGPFPSLLLSPSLSPPSPSPLSLLFPWSRGGVVRKLGVLTPLRRVWVTPWVSPQVTPVINPETGCHYFSRSVQVVFPAANHQHSMPFGQYQIILLMPWVITW